MRRTTLAIIFTGLLFGYGSAALARTDGGGQAAGASHTGGSAPSKISSEGKENTNAKWSADQDKGQARAEERRSTQGAAHEKAKAKSHHAHKAPTKGKKRGHTKSKKTS
jgi:hypothetical protein